VTGIDGAFIGKVDITVLFGSDKLEELIVMGHDENDTGEALNIILAQLSKFIIAVAVLIENKGPEPLSFHISK
jgi:hypothetical protein